MLLLFILRTLYILRIWILYLFLPYMVLLPVSVSLFLEAKAALLSCHSHGALARQHPCVTTLNQGLVRPHSPGSNDAITQKRKNTRGRYVSARRSVSKLIWVARTSGEQGPSLA